VLPAPPPNVGLAGDEAAKTAPVLAKGGFEAGETDAVASMSSTGLCLEPGVAGANSCLSPVFVEPNKDLGGDAGAPNKVLGGDMGLGAPNASLGEVNAGLSRLPPAAFTCRGTVGERCCTTEASD